MNISIDDELRLLKGSSFFVNGIEIKPFTLGQLVDMGYTKYYGNLNVFILNVEDMFQEGIPEEFDDLKMFDVFLNSGINELLESFLTSINIFLKFSKFDIDFEKNIVLLDDKILDRNCWEEICKIIKLQNCMDKNGEEEYNPANERARKFIEKLKKAKANLPKNKEDVTFSSMISGLVSKSNSLNILNVWDLTIYQLYDSLNRANLLDDCYFTLMGIYTGNIDSKKINIKNFNWMKAINNN